MKKMGNKKMPNLVNRPLFLRDTHAHAICGRGEGPGETVWIHLPRFSATNRNLLEPIRWPYSRDAETRNLKWHS